MKFAISNCCSAFSPATIGTKVLDRDSLLISLASALEVHDASKDRVPGQHFVVLGSSAITSVSSGVGRRKPTDQPQDYVLRTHRGRVGAYLHRHLATPVEGLAVVVYTADAYLADPEVTPDEIAAFEPGTTHVIVAVLAAAGPKPPLTPYRFVSNLAGGNRDAETYTIDDVKRIAREIIAYSNDWAIVAD
jgi:hypothetical protein